MSCSVVVCVVCLAVSASLTPGQEPSALGHVLADPYFSGRCWVINASMPIQLVSGAITFRLNLALMTPTPVFSA